MPRLGILFCGRFWGIWIYNFAFGIGDKDSRGVAGVSPAEGVAEKATKRNK